MSVPCVAEPPEVEVECSRKMMIGENFRSNPTVQIPPWDPAEDPTAAMNSSHYSLHSPSAALVNTYGAGDYLAVFHRYLPSNESDSLVSAGDSDPEMALEGFRCDHFRMYVFKVKKCARGRSHDWTECPFAHPGEKARRRDPQRFQYSGAACPDFRKGVCKKGDSCEFAHGVFECWLHPDRYRTQPCKDGPGCRRRVCFFAHTPDQLRAVPQHSPRSSGAGEGDYGSPIRHRFDSYLTKPTPFLSSPTSILTSPPLSPPADSPPMSPNRPQLICGSPRSMTDLISSVRGLGVGTMTMSPRGHIPAGFGSLRCSNLQPGSNVNLMQPGRALSGLDLWKSSYEEPPMERVESGRDLRARMYAKLSKENSLDHGNPAAISGPDFGWISELVK